MADPQLVDPHTYPDRPWPLSTLTVKYTDQYMRRSFSLIQSKLGPDSVLFLGDLFDGGREWATETTSSPEERFQKYGNAFWKQEYERFGRVFSAELARSATTSPPGPSQGMGRRMMASLPGNHDLGFGSGIQVPVRERFETFFGKGNRVDVLGNHTVVAVDTVSLSAMDQPDPATGRTQANEHIWREADDFLNAMEAHRATAETRELRTLQGRTRRDSNRFQHAAVAVGPSVDRPVEKMADEEKPESVGLPTILLSHVPLYRKPATPCGPLREHYPPSSSKATKADVEVEVEDEPNALQLSGGYQYQNVLTQTISNTLVSRIGPRLVHVYSGDDHDYCDIAHREFSGSPREITVKSLSWAMGVRRPGFLLTSLWNPIHPRTGEPITTTSTTTTGKTLQNHLCLLPDQLAVFIWYGLTLAFTLMVLLARSLTTVMHPPWNSSSLPPLLPLSDLPRSRSTSSATLLSSRSPPGLASRATTTTSSSSSSATYLDKDSHKDARPSRRGVGAFWQAVGADLGLRVVVVARVVLVVYAILIWLW